MDSVIVCRTPRAGKGRQFVILISELLPQRMYPQQKLLRFPEMIKTRYMLNKSICSVGPHRSSLGNSAKREILNMAFHSGSIRWAALSVIDASFGRHLFVSEVDARAPGTTNVRQCPADGTRPRTSNCWCSSKILLKSGVVVRARVQTRLCAINSLNIDPTMTTDVTGRIFIQRVRDAQLINNVFIIFRYEQLFRHGGCVSGGVNLFAETASQQRH